MLIFPYGSTEITHLSRDDPALATLITQVGQLERPVEPVLFTALIKNIVEQQISVKAARTVYGRLLALCGQISPESLSHLSLESIQACGMTMRKASYIQHAAQMVASGQLDLEALRGASDQVVIDTLSQLKGVGIWTAEMLLLHSLMRPDIVSWGDLAIRKGMMLLYHKTALSKAEFSHYRQRYTPYGSTASLYLWALAAQAKNGS